MDYLSTVGNATYYIVYPIAYFLSLILYILGIITAPLQHLAHYFWYACWYPIHVLGKFETLYIFFGVAVLVGILTGTSIHYAFSFVLSVLDLDGRAEKQRGRTLSMYRAEKQRRLEEKDPLMKLQRKSGWSIEAGALRGGLGDREKPKGNRGRSGSRLVPNTILEEDSIEDGSSE